MVLESWMSSSSNAWKEAITTIVSTRNIAQWMARHPLRVFTELGNIRIMVTAIVTSRAMPNSSMVSSAHVFLGLCLSKFHPPWLCRLVSHFPWDPKLLAFSLTLPPTGFHVDMNVMKQVPLRAILKAVYYLAKNNENRKYKYFI